MAGGSQIIINKNGITIITPAKFESKAGQHKFIGDEKVPFSPQLLPLLVPEKHLCPLTTVFGGLPNKSGASNFVAGLLASTEMFSDKETENITYEPAPPLTTQKSNKAPLPPIKVVDLSVIKGHTCTAIPPFKSEKKEVTNLSGTYYRTKYKVGGPDYIPYFPDHEKPPISYHFEMVKGQKVSVPIQNFGDRGGRLVNFEFDPVANTLTVSIKIYLYPSKLIETATGDELEYESGVHKENEKDPSKAVNFIKRESTPELVNFVKEKEKLVNSLLNKDGYYFSPKNCNTSGGCSCKVAVILKIVYEITSKIPQIGRDDYVYLLPTAKRQDAKHWSEYEVKQTKTITPSIPVFRNGTIYNEGGGEEKTEYLLQDTTCVFAHESSHLFGFPDEYYANGGAVHKMYVGKDKYIDITITEPQNDWKRDASGTLMSSPEDGKLPDIPPYYYNEFLKIFQEQTHLEWEIKKI